MNIFNKEDQYQRLIPLFIKNKVIVKYLFKDVIKYHPRFFASSILKDSDFVAEICKGLMPRRFKVADASDRILIEEDSEIAEMYFISTGMVGIAFNSFSQSSTLKVVHRQRGI